MNKVKWTVEPVPTGPWRSFHHRGWPIGTTEQDVTFFIRCEDGYVPRKAKAGMHKPLRLAFRDDSVPGGKIRVFKREFATLVDLKGFASSISLPYLRGKLEAAE